MFGGLTLLPLYLQLVKGDSPTKAGLLTLPLVLGLMVSSIIAGQTTSRTGHYRIFPIIGSVLLVTGMLMLWRVSAPTARCSSQRRHVVVGPGLGMNMQTIVLAMQNAVPPRDIGVATSSATFFRQMGGTLGVAVFLSIVYSTVQDKIRAAYGRRRSNPAFRRPPEPTPISSPSCAAASTSTLNDTSFLTQTKPSSRTRSRRASPSRSRSRSWSAPSCWPSRWCWRSSSARCRCGRWARSRPWGRKKAAEAAASSRRRQRAKYGKRGS